MSEPELAVVQMFLATDQGNWERVMECFHQEVVLDYSSFSGQEAASLSPSAIVEAWQGLLPGFESTHHQLGNFISSIDGNSAQVFCYGTASHYLEDEDGSLWTVVGSYDLELILQDGEWKISKLKFNFKYQQGNTALVQKAIQNLK